MWLALIDAHRDCGSAAITAFVKATCVARLSASSRWVISPSGR
jgi:hypothetical protein